MRQTVARGEHQSPPGKNSPARTEKPDAQAARPGDGIKKDEAATEETGHRPGHARKIPAKGDSNESAGTSIATPVQPVVTPPTEPGDAASGRSTDGTRQTGEMNGAESGGGTGALPARIDASRTVNRPDGTRAPRPEKAAGSGKSKVSAGPNQGEMAKELQSAQQPAPPGKNLPVPSDSTDMPPANLDGVGELSQAKTVVNGSNPATNAHGMSVAEQAAMTKDAEKSNAVAVLQGQGAAPPEALGQGEANDIHSADLQTRSSSKTDHADSGTTVGSISVSHQVSSSSSQSASAVPDGAAADGKFQALDRTHELIATHAMRLHPFGASSLHVVIKPSEGVQLSVQLQMKDGHVEAQASLHKGDFEFLNRHWHDLQQRLENRGIRLGTLTTSGNPGAGTGNGSRQPQHRAEPEPLPVGGIAEFTLAGSMTEPPGRRNARAAAHRGWETWA